MTSDDLPETLENLASSAENGDRATVEESLDDLRRKFERAESSEETLLARAQAARRSDDLAADDRELLSEFVGTASSIGLARAAFFTTCWLYVSGPEQVDGANFQQEANDLAEKERTLLERAEAVEAVVADLDLPPVLNAVPVETPDGPVTRGETVEFQFRVRNLGDEAASEVEVSAASEFDVTPDSMTEDSIEAGEEFDAAFRVTADTTGTFSLYFDYDTADARGGSRRVEVAVEDPGTVHREDVEAWQPAYRGLKGRLQNAFQDAKGAWPPGEFEAVLETETFPTAETLAPVDLAVMYGVESAFGTDPTAYDESQTEFFGGFQLGRNVAEKYGLAVTDEATTDGRVEWRGGLLPAAQSGRLKPAWHEVDGLDPFENVEIERVGTVAAQHLFDALRALTTGTFEDVTGEWLQDSGSEPVEIVPGNPGLELSGLSVTSRPGDGRWKRFVPGDDRPGGEAAAYEGLLRQTIRFNGLDETVADLRERIEIASTLKATPEIFEPAVDRDRTEKIVSEFESWLADHVRDYLDYVFRADGKPDVAVADGSALRAASRDVATARDLRWLTYAGYIGGMERVLMARFKAHLRDVGENGRSREGYPGKWEYVRPYLHDGTDASVRRAGMIRSLLTEEQPTGTARITAVDFEDDPERVEIANTTDSPVNLGGWRVRDASGREAVFDEGVILTSTMEVRLDNENVLTDAIGTPFLNDETGDRVELVDDRDGSVVSAFEYDVEWTPVVETDEELTVFRNTDGDSDVIHLAEWDCGQRPPPDQRSDLFTGTPTCGYCTALEQRNVAVCQEWTVPVARDTRRETTELTLVDVEPGRFYEEWSKI